MDDLADACVHLMNEYHDPQNIVNVGTGTDITIKNLAETVADVVGYTGAIMWIPKPNGTLRKVMDVTKLNRLDGIRRLVLKKVFRELTIIF